MKTRLRRFQVHHGRILSSALSIALGCAAFTSDTTQPKPLPRSGVTGKAPPAPVAVQRVDRAVRDYSGIGGSVFATGLGNVAVTVHNVWDFLLNRQEEVYPMTVSMVLSNTVIPLGSNHGKTRTIRLGKLDRGEILLMVNVLHGDGDGVVLSGPGKRNVDDKPRSRVREVSPGVVEVYFEGTIKEGLAGDNWQEQHWFKDMKLTFTGAVTSDAGLLVILDKVNDPDAQTRQAARQSLQMLRPELAQMVAYQDRGRAATRQGRP